MSCLIVECLLRWKAAGSCLLALGLIGCAAGPDVVKVATVAPEDWRSWGSADVSLRLPLEATQTIPVRWWQAIGDATLDRLEARAFDSSPDVRTAALRFAQARVQRITVTAQRTPEISASGSATRQRQSENGASTRLFDVVGGNRDDLARLLSEPFDLYQAGFDASWELDLWGRIGRSIEAADADIAEQSALLALARLTIASDVARNYFELRTIQRQIQLLRSEIAALEERQQLMTARVKGGLGTHFDLDRQDAELAGLRAQLPGKLAQEGASLNQISLLLGEPPGALRPELSAATEATATALPDLRLGLPSEVALRRPDLRAAEARLHRATASIGIAQAQLYPSVRIGAQFGYESYTGSELTAWGSRAWSVGPSLDLPLFDHGRRKSVVQLRELEQQEAAVNYQQTVLKCWQEIDDALSAYVAEQQQAQQLEAKVGSAAHAYELAQTYYQAGTTDYLAVLDSQRSYLLAQQDLASSQGRLQTRYVTINKAIGNLPSAS